VALSHQVVLRHGEKIDYSLVINKNHVTRQSLIKKKDNLRLCDI
jgi:hypothetical protein